MSPTSQRAQRLCVRLPFVGNRSCRFSSGLENQLHSQVEQALLEPGGICCKAHRRAVMAASLVIGASATMLANAIASTRCLAQCGGPQTEDCCLCDSGVPGCSDAACCEAVCDVDAFCCEVAWDCQCRSIGIQSFPQLCIECPEPPPCGAPQAGDCCSPGPPGQVGCQVPDCCEAVCAIDPFCCNVQWDNICANQALGLCQSCDGPCGFANESCCTVHDNNGCDSVQCCALVCQVDDSCCDDAWSQVCVDLAMELCDVCVAPNPFDLDQGGDVDVHDFALFVLEFTGP